MEDSLGEPFAEPPPSEDATLLRGNDKLAAAALPQDGGIVGEEAVVISEGCGVGKGGVLGWWEGDMFATCEGEERTSWWGILS